MITPDRAPEFELTAEGLAKGVRLDQAVGQEAGQEAGLADGRTAPDETG